MIVINFSHPLTTTQRAQIEVLTTLPIDRVIDAMPQAGVMQPFAGQAETIVAELPLSSEDWQTKLLVVNLPGLAPLAAAVLAELHGRMGHFPTILRLRPVRESAPTQYEVAELINLQALRDDARTRRG